MEQNVETELKLLLDKKSLKTLLASPSITKKVIKGSTKELKLITSYYDTPSLALQAAGVAYRVRQWGKHYEATVKTSKTNSGGLSARQEFNISMKNDKPCLTGFKEQGLRVDLEELTEGQQIAKLFTVRVKRLVKLLRISKETTVELAIDQGYVISGKNKDKIDEIELELKSGKVEELLAYAAELAARVPMFIEPRSKYARGLALIGKGQLLKQPALNLRLEKEALCQAACTEALQQLIDDLLLKQNAYLKSGERLRADECFLEDFNQLQALLYWVMPLLSKGAALRQLLSEATNELQRLYEAKRLLLQWNKIAKAQGMLPANRLSLRLKANVEKEASLIFNRVKGGGYTALAYSFMAMLAQSTWKNQEYLLVEELVKCRCSELMDSLETLIASENRTSHREADIPMDLTLGEDKAGMALFYVKALNRMKPFYKLPGCNKATLARLEELQQELEELCYDCLIEGPALQGLKPGKSTELAKEIGLLQGWRLGRLQQRQQKAFKKCIKFLKVR